MIRSVLFATALSVTCGASALAAAPDLAPETHKALWCSLALERVEPSIRAQDEKAADRVITYTSALRQTLVASFRSAGYEQEQVTELQGEVATQVIAELGEGGTPTYNFQDCEALGIAAFRELPSAPPARPATPPAAN